MTSAEKNYFLVKKRKEVFKKICAWTKLFGNREEMKRDVNTSLK